MRRARRGADRVTLVLPVSGTSVALARNAARGLLQRRNGGAEASAGLAAASAELVDAALARARRQDEILIHYDVTPAEILVTVEVRRRGRGRPGTPFRRSLAVEPGGADPSR